MARLVLIYLPPIFGQLQKKHLFQFKKDDGKKRKMNASGEFFSTLMEVSSDEIEAIKG